MNLLDLTENPRDLGLLSLGLRLMSTPGRFGTALGQAGMGAIGDMQQAQQMQDARKTKALQTQMLEMQIAQQQAAAEEAKRQRLVQENDDSILRNWFAPQQGPTQDGAPMRPNPLDPLQAFGMGMSMPGVRNLQALMPKPAEPFTLKPGEQRFGGDNKPVASVPAEPPKPVDLPSEWRLYELSGAKQRGLTFDQWDQARRRAGASNVSYGQPIAGVDANGNPVFFQPDKGGGAPAIVPGVKPPPQKLGEKQQNQVAGIDAMGQAVDAYVEALGKWKKTDTLNPNRRAEIGTFYNNMMLQAKEAYNLGVLNGPDYAILQDVVRDPLSIMGAVTSNEAMAKQATDLKRIMNKIKAGITKTGATDAPSGGPKFLGFEPQ